jgi:hypothetical protein
MQPPRPGVHEMRDHRRRRAAELERAAAARDADRRSMVMTTPSRGMSGEQRRALDMLAGCPDGCTEGTLRAHGFEGGRYRSASWEKIDGGESNCVPPITPLGSVGKTIEQKRRWRAVLRACRPTMPLAPALPAAGRPPGGQDRLGEGRGSQCHRQTHARRESSGEPPRRAFCAHRSGACGAGYAAQARQLMPVWWIDKSTSDPALTSFSIRS